MSIKSWIILSTVFLITATSITISVLFYREFKSALDERVLFQLQSIKRLKRVQIEDYLKEEWTRFNEEPLDSTNEVFLYKKDSVSFLDSIISLKNPQGVHDVSSFAKSGKLTLLFIKKDKDGRFLLKFHNVPKIQKILLERTGMGRSGETYLVGNDFKLRSESRFFSKKPPVSIVAKTKAVDRALKNKPGKDIILDYRNVPVYSAYHAIVFNHVKLVILSEIDVEEATAPLIKLRRSIITICIVVLILVLLITFVLTSGFTSPIKKISDLMFKMSLGIYPKKVKPSGIGTEVKQLYNALNQLQESLSKAIHFADNVGSMNLDEELELVSESDPLGLALIKMRDELKNFQLLEQQNQLLIKQSIIEGQENERKRLSKELHDGIGPLLTTLKIMVQTSDISKGRKDELKTFIDNTITSVRRITYALMPQALLEFPVGSVIKNWLEVLNESSDFEIVFEDNIEETGVINPEVNIALFRIIQELVNNAIKHSKAQILKISVTQFDDKISLFYYDNGIGFDTKQISQGSGLNNIKARVEILNGFIDISSTEKGTQVEVEIPIN